jgi:FkbM family methyltransferase
VLEAVTPPILVSLTKNLRSKVFGGGPGALNGLDVALGRYLDFRGGYFVELGANDGLRQSNTLHLERQLAWRGLLIEPVMHRFFQLVENRDTANHFACVACVPFDFQERWVQMEYADLMTITSGLPSDLPSRKQHLSNAEKFLRANESSITFAARASTLQDLLDFHCSPSTIDFMSLDVEGAELAVFQGVDFSRTRFRFILVESRSIESVVAFLEPHGYELLEKLTVHDYLFRLRVQKESH